jgi:hypothetical protein
MAVCRATKANGESCRAPATGPHGYCWAHDPANAEQRSRMASKAAKSKPRACYELGRKSHRNADFTVSLVSSRSLFPAFLCHF